MKLSVIMPVYNEDKTVKKALSLLLNQKRVFEVVVVDDASLDNSVAEIRKVRNKKIKLYQHKINLGKGAAVRTGLEKVKGDYVLIQDADLEYDPKDIDLLIYPITQGKAKVVYGSRFTGPRKNMFFWHMLGNHFLNLTVNVLYNTTLSDMETCYKLMPTELLKQLDLRADDFTIEPEITCKILLKGEYIYEVPISYTGRTFAEGKKITWVDGLKAIGMILKIRLGI